MILGQSEFTLPSIIRLIDQQLPQENVQWAEEKIKKLSEDLKVQIYFKLNILEVRMYKNA
jgi:hypothetical protein